VNYRIRNDGVLRNERIVRKNLTLSISSSLSILRKYFCAVLKYRTHTLVNSAHTSNMTDCSLKSMFAEQGPTKMDSGTIHRTLSSKGTPLQIGTD
jgi:hypothetical protein